MSEGTPPTVKCSWCDGLFHGAGPGPEWGHDSDACLRSRFAALSIENRRLREALEKIVVRAHCAVTPNTANSDMKYIEKIARAALSPAQKGEA